MVVVLLVVFGWVDFRFAIGFVGLCRFCCGVFMFVYVAVMLLNCCGCFWVCLAELLLVPSMFGPWFQLGGNW